MFVMVPHHDNQRVVGRASPAPPDHMAGIGAFLYSGAPVDLRVNSHMLIAAADVAPGALPAGRQRPNSPYAGATQDAWRRGTAAAPGRTFAPIRSGPGICANGRPLLPATRRSLNPVRSRKPHAAMALAASLHRAPDDLGPPLEEVVACLVCNLSDGDRAASYCGASRTSVLLVERLLAGCWMSATPDGAGVSS